MLEILRGTERTKDREAEFRRALEVLDQLADLMVHFDGEQPEGNEFELILVDNFFEELKERVGN